MVAPLSFIRASGLAISTDNTSFDKISTCLDIIFLISVSADKRFSASVLGKIASAHSLPFSSPPSILNPPASSPLLPNIISDIELEIKFPPQSDSSCAIASLILSLCVYPSSGWSFCINTSERACPKESVNPVDTAANISLVPPNFVSCISASTSTSKFLYANSCCANFNSSLMRLLAASITFISVSAKSFLRSTKVLYSEMWSASI